MLLLFDTSEEDGFRNNASTQHLVSLLCQYYYFSNDHLYKSTAMDTVGKAVANHTGVRG